MDARDTRGVCRGSMATRLKPRGKNECWRGGVIALIGRNGNKMKDLGSRSTNIEIVI